MIVCAWCRKELDLKTAIALPGWGHGCPQEDWQACSDRGKAAYLAKQEKAA